MERRQFLVRTGLLLGAGALAAAAPPPQARSQPDGPDWDAVRDQFVLDPEKVHMSGFLLAPHPAPVRAAIARHRDGLDRNPVDYLHANQARLEAGVLAEAAAYLGVDPTEIALTDSTTMGLGLFYGALRLEAGHEVLTTTHDHYSTQIALQERARRTGARVRTISLYRDIQTVTAEEIVEALLAAVRPETRVVALTWVHSGTGLKLPARAIADALAEVNATRDDAERALLCLDGVHGLGVEDAALPKLGCDVFIAGCHKWLFGPRGTGLVWAKPQAWDVARPVIPSFDATAYRVWMRLLSPRPIPPAAAMTPGGFHSFEHRWALGEAFAFHREIGVGNVRARVHGLNARLKDALAQLGHVTLYTPRDPALSSGIVCFDVRGLHAAQVVERLGARGIVGTVTPYATLYARLAPGLLTSPAEVDAAAEAVAALG